MEDRDVLTDFTIPQLLRWRVEKSGDRVALREKDFGFWNNFTWRQYYELVGKAAFKEKKGREIYVNVDFYSASLYHYMGIASDLFTPIFAISRISGWSAHVIEEQFGGAAAKPSGRLRA